MKRNLTRKITQRNQSNENERSKFRYEAAALKRRATAQETAALRKRRSRRGSRSGARKGRQGAKASRVEAITASASPAILNSPGTTPATNSEITAVIRGPPALVSGATTIALPWRKA